MGKLVFGVVIALVAGFLGFKVATRLLDVNRDFGFEAGPAAAPDPIPGWRQHESKAGGFSIQLPVEFTAFDPKSPKLEEMILDSAKGDAKTREMLENSLKSTEFTFWAFDLTESGKDSGRVVNGILRSKSPNLHQRSTQIAQLRDEFSSRLPRGASLIQFGKVRLPIGNALFTELEFALTESGNLKRTRSYAYLVGVGANELSLTFTCPAGDAEQFSALASRSMATLRLTD